MQILKETLLISSGVILKCLISTVSADERIFWAGGGETWMKKHQWITDKGWHFPALQMGITDLRVSARA